MPSVDFFFDSDDRLRSGWRLIFFILAFLMLLALLQSTVQLVLSGFGYAGGNGAAASTPLGTRAGLVVQSVAVWVAAAVAGWGAGRLFEDLPFSALGWRPHPGWWRDLLTGSLIGAASLLFVAAIGILCGSLRFSLTLPTASPTTTAAAAPLTLFSAVMGTLVSSALIFVVAAAAEEVLFRGYLLQTLLRSWPLWIAFVLPAAFFAAVHLRNPNAVGGFTFVNTVVAGIWLSVAYIRTRSLWFPLGLHWSWNWMQGAVLGLPVSGITEVAPHSLLQGFDRGPAWLTGGAYGVEGGLACTITILLSSAFVWRTHLIRATAEMQSVTNGRHIAEQQTRR